MMIAVALALAQLVDERFDDERALERWTLVDGATVGRDPASRVSIDSGALRFDATKETKRWLAATRTSAIGEATWIRVTARMRTKDVTLEDARFANCNIFVRFGAGPVVGCRMFAGTNDWTAVRRRIEVPAGAKDVTVGCFLSMPGSAWFDDVRIEAADASDWQEAKQGRYVYRWLKGDSVPEKARAYNDESLKLVSEFLGVVGPDSVPFCEYPDLDTKEELMGQRGNQHMVDGAIHSIWASDRHEIVHVLAREWGDPPALLAEGLAVYLSGGWQGKLIRDAARGALDRWIPLADLDDTGAFRVRDDLVTYAIAGALVEWIVGKHGKDKLKAVYGRAKSAAELRRSMEETLGAEVGEIDRQLREDLGR